MKKEKTCRIIEYIVVLILCFMLGLVVQTICPVYEALIITTFIFLIGLIVTILLIINYCMFDLK